MLQGAPPLHLHHASLDAAVTDVAEVLSVLLHAFCHQVRGGGSEAALVLLKVLVIPHLESRCDDHEVDTELMKRQRITGKRCLQKSKQQQIINIINVKTKLIKVNKSPNVNTEYSSRGSQNLTPEMMRWVSLTRLISGVSSTKAALPWTCFRKLSEYSTWGTGGGFRDTVRV